MSIRKLNANERILKSKIDLYRKSPFFAQILMNMDIQKTESENFNTMGVNRFGDLFYSEEFVNELSQEELHGTVIHEAMHIITDSFGRAALRNHDLWNIATDLVINYIITKEGYKLPKMALLTDSKGEWTCPQGKDGKSFTIVIKGKTAEQVYSELEHNATVVKSSNSSGSDKGWADGFDKHLDGDNDPDGNSTGKGGGKKGKKGETPTEAAVKANQQKWKQATIEAATAAKMRGKLSSEMERYVDSITKPVVDWRSKLFAYITNELPVDYTFVRPSRRFCATGVYTPSVVRESLEIIVGVDISGSISGEEYSKFMSECIGIADSYSQVKMRVIGWAHEVHPKDDIMYDTSTKDRLVSNKFFGGGGTTLTCFTKYCEKKDYNSRIYVILTDGFIEKTPVLPKNGDVLFVLSKNGTDKHVKKHGECCSLNDVEE